MAVASCAVFLTVAMSSPGGAQERDGTGVRDCLATLSPDVLTRVPVYLEAELVDSSARHILPSADTLTLEVAIMLRASLGVLGESLPEGEGLLHWRRLGGGLRIVAHRDGRFSWSSPPRQTGADTLHDQSRDLLAQALAAVREAGERVAWPVGGDGDSITFDISYRWPGISPAGTVQAMEARHAVPVFSMAMPWEKPVAVRRQPRIRYPYGAQSRSAEGTVILQFVVDTAGRVDQDTIREQWPADRPRLTGELGKHYEAFLAAARRSLNETDFEPALVGGCVVRQLAQMPFHFMIGR